MQPPAPTEAAPLTARRRGVGTVVVLALVLAALLAWAGWQSRPVWLAEPAQARMPCVSYAPFRRVGHTPFDAALRVTPMQIESDLRLLRDVTGCVRTYGLDHGLDAVPAVARKLGMRVVLGAWIGRDTAVNATQLSRALALSREYADVVDMLVVGNEVLLRRELAPEALATLLAQARREAAVPVAYADVWEFWLRHAQVLRPHVDVVAAHVLPYWEDEPVAAHEAVSHLNAIAARLTAVFHPQRVFIAETGWPAEGRQRGPAVPGARQQAQFARELLAAQQHKPVDFNWIEGFDQPWKRALEGAMGGYWGIFTAEGAMRMQLRGAVRADQDDWRLGAGALAGCAVGGAWWAWARRRRQQRGATAAWILVLSCSLVGALLPWQWLAFVHWNRSAEAWWWAGGLSVVTVACALSAASALATAAGRKRRDVESVDARSAAAAPLPCRQNGETPRADRAAQAEGWFAGLQLALTFGAASMALGLLADPRYRPLTWPLLLAPTVLLGLLAWQRWRVDGAPALRPIVHAGRVPLVRERQCMAAVLALSAPALLLLEGVHNLQAWTLALQWAALSAAVLALAHRTSPAGSS